MFQVFFETPKRGHAGSVLYCATNHCLYSLSSAEASLCCGEAGEKEKESARGTSSTARFLFISIEHISIGIWTSAAIHLTYFMREKPWGRGWGGDRLVLQRTGRAGSKDFRFLISSPALGRTTCNLYNKRAAFDVSTSQAHGQCVLTWIRLTIRYPEILKGIMGSIFCQVRSVVFVFYIHLYSRKV